MDKRSILTSPDPICAGMKPHVPPYRVWRQPNEQWNGAAGNYRYRSDGAANIYRHRTNGAANIYGGLLS